MENFWLIDGNSVIDTCIASSVKEAQKIFDYQGVVIVEIWQVYAHSFKSL